MISLNSRDILNIKIKYKKEFSTLTFFNSNLFYGLKNCLYICLYKNLKHGYSSLFCCGNWYIGYNL